MAWYTKDMKRSPLIKKSTLIAFAVIGNLLIQPVLMAYEETFTTGRDWVESMSGREKYMSLVMPTMMMGEFDIHPRLSLPNYVELIDKQLELNPRLASEDISNIYTATVYAVEPELRGALRDLETRYLRGQFDNEAADTPRLTISTSSELPED